MEASVCFTRSRVVASHVQPEALLPGGGQRRARAATGCGTRCRGQWPPPKEAGPAPLSTRGCSAPPPARRRRPGPGACHGGRRIAGLASRLIAGVGCASFANIRAVRPPLVLERRGRVSPRSREFVRLDLAVVVRGRPHQGRHAQVVCGLRGPPRDRGFTPIRSTDLAVGGLHQERGPGVGQETGRRCPHPGRGAT